jgi:hypothetical protein
MRSGRFTRYALLATTAAVAISGFACGRQGLGGGTGSAPTLAVDSTGAGSVDATAASSVELNTLSVGLGTNQCLIAALALSNASVTGLTLTWGSSGNVQTMAPVVSQTSGAAALLIVDALIAPAHGNKLLHASWTGTSDAVLGAVSLKGADPATCAANPATTTATGKSTTPSILVPSAPDHLSIGVAITSGLAQTGTQSEQWAACITGQAGAASLVQQAGTGASANSQTVTLAAGVTAGSALLACASFDSTQTGVASIAGGGVTWTQAAVGSGNHRTAIWYGLNSAGGSGSITATFAGGTDNSALHVSEWSGLAATNALDVTAQAGGNNSSLPTGTANTTHAADLLFACGAQDQETVTTGPLNGFTALTSVTASADKQEEAYRNVSATGAYKTGWTLTGNPQESVAILAAFQVTSTTPTIGIGSAASTARGGGTHSHRWTTSATADWAAVGMDIAPSL